MHIDQHLFSTLCPGDPTYQVNGYRVLEVLELRDWQTGLAKVTVTLQVPGTYSFAPRPPLDPNQRIWGLALHSYESDRGYSSLDDDFGRVVLHLQGHIYEYQPPWSVAPMPPDHKDVRDDISHLEGEIDGLLKRMGAVEETLSEQTEEQSIMSATEVIKGNATTAIKTSGANAVNEKLIDKTIIALKERGVDVSLVDTPIGRDVTSIIVTALGLYGSLNPTIRGTIGPNLADKLAKVFTYANQGAFNKSADRLIKSFLPVLQTYAELADQIPDETADAAADAQPLRNAG